MDTKISQTIELSFDTLKTTLLKIKTKIGEIDTKNSVAIDDLIS